MTPPWKFAILPTLCILILTSLPQLNLCYQRGVNWHGGFAWLEGDEFGYSGYVQSLIDGHPRVFDPYTGTLAAENFYSIQFLPAYLLAIPGRLLGVSAFVMFWVTAPILTAASCMTIFWLINDVTNNKKIAAISILAVLILGTLAVISIPGIRRPIPGGFGPLPFLRRYVPAVPFPLIFLTPLFIWKALTKDLRWAIGAGACFAILVFSYFYLWTAILAWFAAILVLWAMFHDRGRALKVFGIIAPFSLAIIPFAWLITHRAAHSNSDLTLRLTHAPDLTQTSEVFGLLILIFLLVKKRNTPARLFAASFALVPFLIFNQQVITGRSLQPFHYQVTVANYWVILSIMLLLGLWRTIPKRIPIYLTASALLVGIVLSVHTARKSLGVSIRLDQIQVVREKLKKLGPGRVFAPDNFITNGLVSANNPMLWASQSYTYSNITHEEQRRRYYTQLYLRSIAPEEIKRMLKADFFTRFEAFGDRPNEMITTGDNPITQTDLDNAEVEIAAFYRDFRPDVILRYAVIADSENPSNLDRWYDRKAVATVEDLTIYRLELRQ